MEKFMQNGPPVSEGGGEEKPDRNLLQKIADAAIDKAAETAGKIGSGGLKKAATAALVSLEVLRAASPALAQEKPKEKPSEPAKVESLEIELSQKTKDNLARFDLSGIEEKDRKEWKERIGFELEGLKSLSEDINGQVKEKTGENLPGLNFDDRAVNLIEEAEKFNKELITKNDNEKKEAAKDRRFKILNMAGASAKKFAENFPSSLSDAWNRISLKEWGKALPFGVSAFAIALYNHERSHGEVAKKYGAENVKLEFGNLDLGYESGEKHLGGKIDYENLPTLNDEEGAEFAAAGLESNRKIAEFLTDLLRADSLRGEDEQIPALQRQLIAMVAATTRFNGLYYAFREEFTEFRKLSNNDINEYARRTRTNPDNIASGLAASYVFSPDTWRIIRMAFGDESVKLSDKSLDIFYELNARGPRAGVRYQKFF